MGEGAGKCDNNNQSRNHSIRKHERDPQNGQGPAQNSD